MPNDPQNFKAPFIDQQQCWNEADKCRQLPEAEKRTALARRMAAGWKISA